MDQEHESGGRPAGAPMVPARPPRQEAASESAIKASEPEPEGGGTGSQLASSARGRAADEVGRRSTQAGERVGGAASDAREIAEGLREKGRTGPAELLEEVASRMDDVGGYLKRVDMDQLLSDIRGFGQRRPGVLVAGAAVVGIAAGRVLKASDPASDGGASHG